MTKSKLSIELTNNGTFSVNPETGNRRKIAASIKLRAIGKRDRDDVTLAEIRFSTIHGSKHSECFEFSNLLPENRKEIKKRLADLGYEWPEEKGLAQAILKAVAKARPKRRFRMVDAPGWYDSAFVLPHRVFAARNDRTKIHIDPKSAAHVGAFILGAGSLQDWQKRVAVPARKSSRLRLAIASGLAAAFVRPLALDSFGLNFFSQTSDGKTLLLIVAASVAGLYGPAGLPAWADSEAGLEAIACGHRDNVMPLDEMGDGEHQMQLDKKARLIAFLVARNRPRKLSKAYERDHNIGEREYRIILLSTSERGLRQIAHAAGTPRLGGEEVRFIDIPASEPGSMGIIDGTMKSAKHKTLKETSKEFVENLKIDAIKYQGHALDALMRNFMNDQHGLVSLKRYKQDFETRATLGDVHNAHYRVRSNFALLYAAAVLAIDYGILPWGKGGTFQAIEKCMRLALAELDTGSRETAGGLVTTDIQHLCGHLKAQLERANIVEVKPKEKITDEQARDRQLADGFRINGEIFLKPERFKQWIPAKAERILLKANHVLRTERNDTPTVERKIAGINGKPRYYAVDPAVLDRLMRRPAT